MNFDIHFDLYVKTSAKGKTGIHWRHIQSPENQPLVDTPDLINVKVWETESQQRFFVNDLIDEYKPSLLIFRKDGKLLLEVSGIESAKRSEELGRRVLNLIVWTFDDTSENEQIVRMIADSAIQSFLNQDARFNHMIETAISFHQLEEFKVDMELINQFIENLKTDYQQIFLDNAEIKYKYLIETKSDQYLDELSAELRKSHLPKKWDSYNGEKKDGVLVVVTDYLSNNTILHNVAVWRGFANNVQEPVKIKIPKIEPQKKTETQPLEIQETQERKNHKNPLPLLLIVGIIVILIIVLVVVNMKQLKIQPQKIEATPQETVTPQTEEKPELLQEKMLTPQTEQQEILQFQRY
ncbi:hypothetical protein MEN41_13400 [Dolichospermum sp. ST_con]|nr:hypothetical protein [Dolichospermum sp. ST_con]MDD1419284.1 hypothetical protein [Dolichospermum sp. ST_sed1]MDD1424898.1 hypothetical protein [Dolichospermum sp. ST_sed9]MDD1430730.1 hypothetical protein [Dolichospermum sp. ST_sed6]MDD1435547.1 hypothetical protein [Dolichospermum sp. ST_sed10]MDD1441606.1 hypothetical protein [Dolichospermum sp. ST_sed3]MDD1446832.1 hypothetical protein [Dolichospermum sp. ST_sed8]MDD1454068.1 hypothetical protein [Dolichospermum sp. ST_sed7]MDD146172